MCIVYTPISCFIEAFSSNFIWSSFFAPNSFHFLNVRLAVVIPPLNHECVFFTKSPGIPLTSYVLSLSPLYPEFVKLLDENLRLLEVSRAVGNTLLSISYLRQKSFTFRFFPNCSIFLIFPVYLTFLFCNWR